MSSEVPSQHYAKGEAKRRAILDAALALVAERGYRNSTLQEIADAVGLSKAGVLHYFTSREELIAEVIRVRDEHNFVDVGREAEDTVELLRATMRHNHTVPGLVELYSRLVVEAESPEHPAHGFVRSRYERTADAIAAAVRARQQSGTLNPDVDPLALARMLVAISDGLQLQWMYNREIDMSEILDVALALVQPVQKKLLPAPELLPDGETASRTEL